MGTPWPTSHILHDAFACSPVLPQHAQPSQMSSFLFFFLHPMRLKLGVKIPCPRQYHSSICNCSSDSSSSWWIGAAAESSILVQSKKEKKLLGLADMGQRCKRSSNHSNHIERHHVSYG